MRSALTRIRRFGRGSSLSPAVLFGHPVSDLCACPMSTKGSSDDAQPEVRRQRRVGQAEAFELDVGPAPAVEQPDAVAEQDGRDAHEDLVQQTRVEALPGGAGAEDVDVLVTRGGPGRGDAAVEVTDEGDIRYRGVRGMAGKHELRSVPPPAERPAFLGLDALVRIVAAEGAAADEKGADLADHMVRRRVGPEVLGQPGHVTTWAGDEAVQRHSGRIQQLTHELPPSRSIWVAPVETADRAEAHRCVGGNARGQGELRDPQPPGMPSCRTRAAATSTSPPPSATATGSAWLNVVSPVVGAAESVSSAGDAGGGDGGPIVRSDCLAEFAGHDCGTQS